MGMARWAWRELTSMRTALILLVLLALAAVPGSLLPQRGVASDPGRLAAFQREYPTLAPWLERLSLFEVYSAPWFAALYLLLLTSLTGCVLPRCARLWRSTRAEPPRAPSSLARLPGHRRWDSDRATDEVLAAAATELRRRHFRVRVQGGEVRAEKGYLREAGNLTFHLSLLVLLFGVAAGSLFGFEGRVIVVEGATFAHVRSAYDDFTPGPWVDSAGLEPFAFTLTDFSAAYEPSGPQRGTPRDFTADVEYRTSPEAPKRRTQVRVNHPLQVGGTKVFLTGNGYAPRFTVRDGRGQEVFTGPAVFLPRDGNLTSEGIVKAPDAQPTQLAFEGFFLPTAAINSGGPFSAFPDTLDPRVLLTAYTGDLGLDDGVPQSVFSLDKDALTQVTVNDQPLARALRVGDVMSLPNGQGSISFEGVSRFANFQIAYDPGKEVSLAAAVLLLVGLTMSLSVRRRRVWVRARPRNVDGTEADASTVELATSVLTRRGTPHQEAASIAELLGDDIPSHPGQPPRKAASSTAKE